MILRRHGKFGIVEHATTAAAATTATTSASNYKNLYGTH
jgi:hypothetical protein